MDNIKGFPKINNHTIHSQTITIVNEYRESMEASKKSEATITKYLWILEQFFKECSIPLQDLTSKDVLIWLNNFTEGKSARTIDLFLSCLSKFFRFCLAEEYIEKEIVIKSRWRPKIPKSMPRYLTEQECAQVKLAAESFSIRDRALILFLFASGCRRKEVSNLNLQDINLKQRTAMVVGKGNKYRIVHFTEECLVILQEYLLTRSSDKTDALFINRQGLRLLPKGIYEIVKKVGKKAGIKFHPHCCRHTFATNLMARGATLELIADELGHTNLNTTRIYASIPTEDMILAYQNKKE